MNKFPDKVGRDRANAVTVRYRGEIQRPRFRDVGAAEAFLDGLRNGTRKPEPEQTCLWFLLCDRATIGTLAHPILGDVPICERCAKKIGELDKVVRHG
jgi:hypothetical protein